MRVLHLYGDYKWTGPAEPTVNLCLKLREMGHDIRFACCPSPAPHPQTLEAKARERGLEPITAFPLHLSFNIKAMKSAARELGAYIRQAGCEIIHVHQGRDHFAGVLGARHSRTGVRIVRTNHRAEPLADSFRSRLLLKRFTHGLIEISRNAAERDGVISGLPPEAIGKINGAVDLQRFNPERKFQDMRPRFGFRPSHVVVGLVARLQRRRKFDLFLQAMRIACDAMSAIRALVLGRGTHMREVAVEPARQMGLGDKIVFAGYLDGREEYEAALAAFDMKVFLVPGSDGSCRAVLEAMAMGKPVIAARCGVLPEIIEHERTGILVGDDPNEIADWTLRLAGHPARRRKIGSAARAEAESSFTLEAQAESVLRIYENVLASPRRR